VAALLDSCSFSYSFFVLMNLPDSSRSFVRIPCW